MTCEYKMSEAKDDGTHSYILPSHAVGCRLVKVPSIRKTKCNIYGKKMHSSKKMFKGAFLGQNGGIFPVLSNSYKSKFKTYSQLKNNIINSF